MAGTISPDGEHHEIDVEGVAALEALGWERVQPEPESEPEPAARVSRTKK